MPYINNKSYRRKWVQRHLAICKREVNAFHEKAHLSAVFMAYNDGQIVVTGNGPLKDFVQDLVVMEKLKGYLLPKNDATEEKEEVKTICRSLHDLAVPSDWMVMLVNQKRKLLSNMVKFVGGITSQHITWKAICENPNITSWWPVEILIASPSLMKEVELDSCIKSYLRSRAFTRLFKFPPPRPVLSTAAMNRSFANSTAVTSDANRVVTSENIPSSTVPSPPVSSTATMNRSSANSTTVTSEANSVVTSENIPSSTEPSSKEFDADDMDVDLEDTSSTVSNDVMNDNSNEIDTNCTYIELYDLLAILGEDLSINEENSNDISNENNSKNNGDGVAIPSPKVDKNSTTVSVVENTTEEKIDLLISLTESLIEDCESSSTTASKTPNINTVRDRHCNSRKQTRTDNKILNYNNKHDANVDESSSLTSTTKSPTKTDLSATVDYSIIENNVVDKKENGSDIDTSISDSSVFGIG